MSKEEYREYITINVKKRMPELNRIALAALLKDFLYKYKSGEIDGVHVDSKTGHVEIDIKVSHPIKNKAKSEASYVFGLLNLLFNQDFLDGSGFREILVHHRAMQITLQ